MTFIAFLSAFLAVGVLPSVGQTAQGSAPAPQLKPYTAPDGSASAGVPPGWNVTKGGQSVIVMTGPNNETIFLGTTVVVRNAAFQLGEKSSNGVDMSMPNSSSLSQKFTMIIQNGAVTSGQSAPQVTIASETPVQVPAALGQCARVAGSYTGSKGQFGFGSVICSLPVDVGSTYKVIMIMAQAPPDVAAQEKALAGAVFASYRVPPATLQLKLAPHFIPAPSAPRTPGPAPAIGVAPGGFDADCFDLIVIRETPKYKLPKHCGGLAPDE